MTRKTKTILITGGAGFIGSHVLEDVLKNKKWDEVVMVDNLVVDNGTEDKKGNFKHLLSNPKLKFYEYSIVDGKKMEEVFLKHIPEAVVHLAAIADTRNAVEEPHKYIDTNVNGTLNLLEGAKKAGTKKFVFFSSSSVYGNKNKAPFTELMQADFAISPYGATKKSGEVLAHTYSHNHKLPIIALRIFNAYGPRMRPNLVLYKWVKTILDGKEIEMSGKGTRKRDYTYVGDIVDAVNKSLNKKMKDGEFEVLNIGNSNPVALKDLLKKVEKVLKVKANVKSRPNHKKQKKK
jgi:UDP-glucuronate 4-epimerase